MREAEVFVLADHALNEVIQQVKDDQWTMAMPADFAMRGVDHTPTLREVVNYHAYDDAWVPDMLAGRTMDEAGRDKFDGDLLGTDPKGNFAAIVDTACAAAAQLNDPDQIVHCSFGDFSAREYFWQINGFRGLRAHDVGLMIGVEPRLSDELVRGGSGTRSVRTSKSGVRSGCFLRPCLCRRAPRCWIACWASPGGRRPPHDSNPDDAYPEYRASRISR